jgi:hypothetical protein
MATRDAACSCGQLRLTANGEPIRISMCHCLACQRRTGSAFGIQARFSSDCGATVFYTLAAFPDVVAVPIGAFADPSFPSPRVAVYESRKHPWLEVTTAMEHHD